MSKTREEEVLESDSDSERDLYQPVCQEASGSASATAVCGSLLWSGTTKQILWTFSIVSLKADPLRPHIPFLVTAA